MSAIRLNRACLICLVALASCTSQQQTGCPAIEQLAHRDPVADAHSALAKGDTHLLMLGGFVGSVPGVSHADGYATRMIEGTADTRTEACTRKRALAAAYATKYNGTIVRGR